jgi:serine/threonine protein kinase
MSAEPRRVTNAEVWTEWENRVVNGVFPLRRFLGRSNHSAVFLTEYKAENLPEVAIKFVPADALQTEAQLVQWGAAATLSHPHLVRIFDVGRCQFRGRAFLFVVMEYAEQTLAQILPQRALTPDEVRELLPPTLGALGFLHRNNLVHGQLKPSNFLVVNDQLKLASDTVRPLGNSPSGIARTSLYDPPELKDGTISTAGDAWGLGITLVEALTQRTPAWPEDRTGTVSLPASFPAPFVDTVQRCLSRSPADRPTLAELESQYKVAPQARVASIPQPSAREAPREAAPPQSAPKKHRLLPNIAAVLLISLAVWVGLRLSQKQLDLAQSTSATSESSLQPPAASPPGEPAPVEPETAASAATAAPPIASAPTAAASEKPASAPTAAATAQAASAPDAPAPAASTPADPAPNRSATAKSAQPNAELSSPASRPLDQPSLAPAATSSSVLHEVLPDVSQDILDKIRGHINVRVRVLVDPLGNVVGEFLENPGPSRYFARVAGDAAGEWKFAPADIQGSRVWLLRFEFTRGGATVDATAAQ